MLNSEFDWSVLNSNDETDWLGEEAVAQNLVDSIDCGFVIVNGVLYEDRDEK